MPWASRKGQQALHGVARRRAPKAGSVHREDVIARLRDGVQVQVPALVGGDTRSTRMQEHDGIARGVSKLIVEILNAAVADGHRDRLTVLNVHHSALLLTYDAIAVSVTGAGHQLRREPSAGSLAALHTHLTCRFGLVAGSIGAIAVWRNGGRRRRARRRTCRRGPGRLAHDAVAIPVASAGHQRRREPPTLPNAPLHPLLPRGLCLLARGVDSRLLRSAAVGVAVGHRQSRWALHRTALRWASQWGPWWASP